MRRLAGGDELSSGPRKKLGVFVALLDELRDSSNGPLAALAERILERTGYLEKLAGERSTDAQDRAENLLELVGSLRDFEREMTTPDGQPPTLVEYLERVSLVSPTDDQGRGVVMMTVHASKGLEFPVVFITGLEDGVFPSLRDGEDEELLEEERRLMYVAVTRARERLFFTNARERTLFGQQPRPFRESRFPRRHTRCLRHVDHATPQSRRSSAARLGARSDRRRRRARRRPTFRQTRPRRRARRRGHRIRGLRQ